MARIEHIAITAKDNEKVAEFYKSLHYALPDCCRARRVFHEILVICLDVEASHIGSGQDLAVPIGRRRQEEPLFVVV